MLGWSEGFHDQESGRRALADVVDGLIFDVEQNALWLDEWGARPVDAAARAAIVRAAVAIAPPLIPLMGHRFLVGAPPVAGNPVLSIVQGDIIIYAPDLASWLDLELLQIQPPPFVVPSIPFWGRFL
jgi:hypothetical protein